MRTFIIQHYLQVQPYLFFVFNASLLNFYMLLLNYLTYSRANVKGVVVDLISMLSYPCSRLHDFIHLKHFSLPRYGLGNGINYTFLFSSLLKL